MKQQKGLKFSYMGGVGKINCDECGYTVKVLSFTHGFTHDWKKEASTTGYQCLACGKFARVSEVEGDDVTPSEMSCKCGGQLSRDHVLFCPKCKSKKLSYFMDYIT